MTDFHGKLIRVVADDLIFYKNSSIVECGEIVLEDMETPAIGFYIAIHHDGQIFKIVGNGMCYYDYDTYLNNRLKEGFIVLYN